jgi:hypothetical protein
VPELTLLRAGRWLRVLAREGTVLGERALSDDPEAAAREWERPGPALEPLRRWLAGFGADDRWTVSEEALGSALGAGFEGRIAGLELRRAREQGWRTDPAERAFVLALARRRLEIALTSPEETLIALAREEERVERVLRREVNAEESWPAESPPSLRGYAQAVQQVRQRLREHHDFLVRLLENEARRDAPNLSAVVGPKTAARLVAAAGGKAALARLSASRLQLLGARRRLGPGRNPRFGHLFAADGMSLVPPARAGAYARTLAALAVVAARADALTGRAIAEALVRRRTRRVDALRQGRRFR